MSFNRQETAILQALHRERMPLSIHELAMLSHLSWTTCKRYLHALAAEGYVLVLRNKRESARVRIKWQFNFEKQKSLQKR